MANSLKNQFGDIDIYLFDQLLKGRFDSCKSVVDVGCGGGRNLVYFLQNGLGVYGVDPDPKAIEQVQSLAGKYGHPNPEANFVVATAEELPFPDAQFDLVICSAVLHFAQSENQFRQMLQSMWRILKPGGYFFARLASSIGIESLVKPVGAGRFLLPDGSVRYLVTEDQLLRYGHLLGGTLFEPIKTTNVQNLRCMSTWCLQKNL